MGKSWELSDEQLKEIRAKQSEIAAQYDPETGKKKTKNVDNTGDGEDIGQREREKTKETEDDYVR